MKLLSPLATQESKNVQLSRDVLRSQEAEELAKESQKKLQRAEIDFARVLQGQQARYQQEEEEHQIEVKRRQKEIDILESKKLNASIPLDILNFGTNERINDASLLLARVRDRENTAEELCETFEEKLSELGEREITLIDKEKKHKLREEGMQRQTESISHRAKELSDEMQSFRSFRAQEEKTLTDKKIELMFRERTLENKAEKLARKEKDLSNEAIRLIDERGTLERAFSEVERMRGKISP